MSKNMGTIDFNYMDTRNTDVQNHWNHWLPLYGHKKHWCPKPLESLTSIVRTQETLLSKKH